MMQVQFLRAPGNYDVDVASDESGLFCDPDEGVTQQQFAEECDINVIVGRFGLTGELPEVAHAPVSGDFSGVFDYQSALNAVLKAEEGFMEFPGELRARFNNDPQRLMEFLDNPANREEAIKLGLVNKPVEKTRDMIQAIDELAGLLPVAKPPANL